jgi:hypothetical protein
MFAIGTSLHFRCAAEFDRYRGIADIEQAAPIERDSRGHALGTSGVFFRTRQKVAPGLAAKSAMDFQFGSRP